MALRAKKPTAKSKRLKLFMYGDAGVGKTTAGLQLPKPYIIDAERGTENYHKLINKVGGAVLHTKQRFVNLNKFQIHLHAIITQMNQAKKL